jgi:hypothetical protein
MILSNKAHSCLVCHSGYVSGEVWITVPDEVNRVVGHVGNVGGGACVEVDWEVHFEVGREGVVCSSLQSLGGVSFVDHAAGAGVHVPRLEETELLAPVDVTKRDSSENESVVGGGVEVFGVDSSAKS